MSAEDEKHLEPLAKSGETEDKKEEEEAVQTKEGVEEDLLSHRNALCRDMFEKIAAYLNGELAGIPVVYGPEHVSISLPLYSHVRGVSVATAIESNDSQQIPRHDGSGVATE